MQPDVIRIGWLLEKVCRYATRVAATMVAAVAMLMVAAIGGNVVLHADQAVGMVMMRNDRNHQHHDADEEQEKRYVLFLSHSFFI